MAPRYEKGIKNLQTALLLVLKDPSSKRMERDRCQAIVARVNELLAGTDEEELSDS